MRRPASYGIQAKEMASTAKFLLGWLEIFVFVVGLISFNCGDEYSSAAL